jgi:hypothetical protein
MWVMHPPSQQRQRWQRGLATRGPLAPGTAASGGVHTNKQVEGELQK